MSTASAILSDVTTVGPIGYSVPTYAVVSVAPYNPAPPSYPVAQEYSVVPYAVATTTTTPCVEITSTPCVEVTSTPCVEVTTTPCVEITTTPCATPVVPCTTPIAHGYEATPDTPTVPCTTPVVHGYEATPETPVSTPCETPNTPQTPCDDVPVVTSPAAYGDIYSGAQANTFGAIAVAFAALFL